MRARLEPRCTILPGTKRQQNPPTFRPGDARWEDSDEKGTEINAIQGDGAQGRSRTTDTRIFSPLLYQLSYLGILSRNRSVGWSE